MKKILCLLIIAGAMISCETFQENGSADEASWIEKAQLPITIGAGGAAVSAGKIFHFGGNSGYGAYVDTVLAYIPSKDIWEEKTPMPTARKNMAVTSVDGKIFVIGGDAFQDTNEMYDPETDLWESRAPMPTKRQHIKGASVNGRIYIIGGLEDWETVSVKNESYNPENNTWTEMAQIPVPKHNYSAAVIGTRIYIVGGATKSGGDIWKDTDTIECYDTIDDSWETVFTMPEVRFSPGISVVNECIYIIGGFINGVVSDKVFVYNPQTNEYYESESLPLRNVFMGSVSIDNRLYVFGGTGGPGNDWSSYDTLLTFDSQ